MRRFFDRLIDVATVVGVVFAVAVGVRAMNASNPSPPKDRVIEDWEQYTAYGERIGPDDAPVRIVEWGDYQCPGCRRFSTIVPKVLAQYEGEVQFIYRHWPLRTHERAYVAARAAECAADQDRFWEMHEALNREVGWGAAEDVVAEFVNLADSIEIPDGEAFRVCVEDAEPHPRIERDLEAIRGLETRGTPTVIVNGVYPATFPDSARLVELVESALSERR